MYKVKCYKDILALEANNSVPTRIITMLKEELVRVKDWCDEFSEASIEEFHTDDYDFGYIAIFEGNETDQEIEAIGLTDGLEAILPEVAYNYFIDGEKWTKIIVIYNDSYSMSVWLKNCDIFDSYVQLFEEDEEYTMTIKATKTTEGLIGAGDF